MTTMMVTIVRGPMVPAARSRSAACPLDIAIATSRPSAITINSAEMMRGRPKGLPIGGDMRGPPQAWCPAPRTCRCGTAKFSRA